MAEGYQRSGASVLIAAHNEGGTIGQCLDALGAQLHCSSVSIIVIANGCSDDTAETARKRDGVKVLEIPQGSKPLALNAGDRVADSFPRIYLDADIVPPRNAVSELTAALEAGGALVAVPDRVINTAGKPWAVRHYYAVSERIPAFREGLFGRGMIALSAAGRLRFKNFPLMVADDLFLDSLFTSDEKAHVLSVVVEVDTPQTVGDLVRRLARVRRGNRAMRRAAQRGDVPIVPRESDHWAWLRDIVLPQPKLALSGAVYAVLTVIADVLARRGSVDAMVWGHPSAGRSNRKGEGGNAHRISGGPV